MSILDELATNIGRKDDKPNQALAKKLAETQDHTAIGEIAAALSHPDKNIQSDCIKVLYEIGYLDPALIAPYAKDFLTLLHSRNNRLVWGGMIALAAIAEIEADFLFTRAAEIQKAIDKGSVITIDNGIKTLGIIASQSRAARETLFPYLLDHLQTCRPKDIPQHAEHTLPAVSPENREAFITVLKNRLDILRPSQAKRVKKVIAAAEKITG